MKLLSLLASLFIIKNSNKNVFAENGKYINIFSENIQTSRTIAPYPLFIIPGINTLTPSSFPTTKPDNYRKKLTKIPTSVPIYNRKFKRTKKPTHSPTSSPTKEHTNLPTKTPTYSPISLPTYSPTKNPYRSPKKNSMNYTFLNKELMIQNNKTQSCLAAASIYNIASNNGLEKCNKNDQTQLWYYFLNKFFVNVNPSLCLDAYNLLGITAVQRCNTYKDYINQKLVYTNDYKIQFFNYNNKCLSFSYGFVLVEGCVQSNPYQIWNLIITNP